MTITYTYGYEYSDSTQKDLRIRPYSMDMENHIVTLPKKGLKARPYGMNMNKEDHIVTAPKKDLKTRPYNIGMEKRDLKTRPYSIDMEKKDLKKLNKSDLIKMLFKQKESKKVRNHEDLLNKDPFKDKRTKAEKHKRLQDAFQNPLESHHLHQSLKLKIA